MAPGRRPSGAFLFSRGGTSGLGKTSSYLVDLPMKDEVGTLGLRGEGRETKKSYGWLDRNLAHGRHHGRLRRRQRRGGVFES